MSERARVSACGEAAHRHEKLRGLWRWRRGRRRVRHRVRHRVRRWGRWNRTDAREGAMAAVRFPYDTSRLRLELCRGLHERAAREIREQPQKRQDTRTCETSLYAYALAHARALGGHGGGEPPRCMHSTAAIRSQYDAGGLCARMRRGSAWATPSTRAHTHKALLVLVFA